MTEIELDQKFNSLTILVNQLQKRREQDTLANTTKQVIMIVREVVSTMTAMYSVMKMIKQQLQNGTLTVSSQQTESTDEIDNETGLLSSELDQIKEWNNSQTAKVLFKGNDISTKRFNEIVGDHKNVCIVIKTNDNHSFGVFASKLNSIAVCVSPA